MKDLAAGLPVASRGDDLLAARVLNKVTWRLIPFLALLYIFNILDRANVCFARLTMQGDLGMSDGLFNLAVGNSGDVDQQLPWPRLGSTNVDELEHFRPAVDLDSHRAQS